MKQQRMFTLAKGLNYLEQLKLLMWKSFLLQKRSPLSLLLILLLPTVFALILMAIRISIESTSHKNTTIFKTFSLDEFDHNLMLYKNSTFSYYPNTSDITNSIMKQAALSLNLRYLSFQTENEMLDYLKEEFKFKFFGVAILNESISNFTYELRFSYSPRNEDIRINWKDWKVDFIHPYIPFVGPRAKQFNTGGEPGYFTEGFLIAQKAIDMAIIRQFSSNFDTIGVELRRFPFGPYEEDNFTLILVSLFPYVMELSFIFVAILTARAIVYEKEIGMKEAMYLIGVKPWLYWLSWYIKTFLLLLPSLLMMSLCYTIKLPNKLNTEKGIIDKTSPYIFALLLFEYGSSLIIFTFVCSCFFKKSNTATAGTGIIYFLTYLPYVWISIYYDKIHFNWKIVACLVNNLALSLGIQLIGLFESSGIGIDFNNWTKGINPEDEFSMFHVLIFLVLNNFIYAFLTYYFDNVLPGDHGIAKPWNFMFKKLLKKNSKKQEQNGKSKLISSNENNNRNENGIEYYFEDESIYSKTRKIGIKIENLNKKYKQLNQYKTAVDNLNLNIYEGQITVLLGHNGAGKSTTISMITGLLKSSSGNIVINDKNINDSNEKEDVRRLIGYCPQHNLLFDNMTVYEHLKFFSKLKQNYSEQDIDTMLELVDLKDKKDSFSKTLSTGMKRRLSVGLSLIGGSKIIILDEPTSGMDPQARHTIWSLLKKFKNENKCTILLTTHYMDEADYLGDRIAIMSNGRLRCCGSPLFLKSKQGNNYNLTLTANNKRTMKKYKILSLVQSVIPESKILSIINCEITIFIPVQQTKKLVKILELLEKQKNELDIGHFGVNGTTLEQVFMNIERAESNNDGISESNSLLENAQNSIGLFIGSQKDHLIKNKLEYYFNQFFALVIKRVIYSTRNKLFVSSQIIFPLLVLFANLIFLKYGPLNSNGLSSLLIDMSSYDSNYLPILIRNHDETNQEKNSSLNSITNFYLGQFNSSVVAFNLKQNDSDLCVTSRKSMKDYLKCLANLKTNRNYYVGVEFILNKNSIKILSHFNNQPYHVAPLAVNLVSNSLFKHFTNSTESAIRCINHPLPKDMSDTLNEIVNIDVISFLLSSGLTFGLSFLMASYSVFLIMERVSGSKHLQTLKGCNSFIFWLNNFFWDMINFIVCLSLIISTLMIFKIDGFIGEQRAFYIAIMFLFYVLAHLPQMYVLSCFFSSSSSGFSIIIIWNILTSQLTLIITKIFSFPVLKELETSYLLEFLFSTLFPNFALGQALMDIYDNSKISKVCNPIEKWCGTVPNPCCRYSNATDLNPCGEFDCLYWTNNYLSWEKPGLLRLISVMLTQSIFYFLLLFFIESGLFKNVKSFFTRKLDYSCNERDSDVVEEENRITNMIKNKKFEDLFVVDKLMKTYDDFLAVKGISFGIKSAECFGLLGVNGAGKTTTFKMITGDELITNGNAYLNEISIKKDLKQFQKQLGYCPQIDPLIDQMTVLETMLMFARIRGIKNELIHNLCLSLIDLLDLSEHVNKMCYTLSGGNKRKLSVAIALVGSPSIILLDEPTSGMDPKTRRILWNSLNKIRNKGKSLILTTHSMDETEALCTKIGIMVNGELKCYGSLHRLLHKYGNGYSLQAKINPLKTKEFIQLIHSVFSNYEVKENRDGYLNFHLKNDSKLSLNSIFSLIESNKSNLSIEFYTITQTRLEQIFLNFSTQQIEINLDN